MAPVLLLRHENKETNLTLLLIRRSSFLVSQNFREGAGENAVTAITFSKSVLRAVAGQIATERADTS